MRLNKAIVLLMAVALLGWGLGAQDQPVTIGVIDVQQALVSTEEGKKVKEELERKVRAAESQLQPKIQRLQEMQKELQEMQPVLSKEALQKKQFDLVEQKSQLENEGQGLEQQLKLDQARLMQPLLEKFAKIIDEIGREKGFALILDRQDPGILFSRETLDITDLAVAEFNKKG